MLLVKNLNVSVKNISILKKLNLEINPGEIHIIMGPNGSGKSTLSATLSGQQNYTVTNGEILFKNKNLLLLKPEERAGEGIFVAFQHPVDIPGISNQSFLHHAVNAVRKYRHQPLMDRFHFIQLVQKNMALLKMPNDLLNRSVNVGFSGGEKKRNDILQMMMLEPLLCILDETDSGLDIDAIKIVYNGLNILNDKIRSFVIITHYQRILEYIKPNYVHVLHKGHIVKSGDISLVKQLEEKGYGWLSG
ncbi:putative transport protein associated with Fe-S cluster assembly (ABC superfamily, atp_bind) [Candidatus Blochmanniella pennsylvanica str. BPEN]|uniref:Putative transport protein associated with Fe-S cluster assembly (ABC superfamily, atp_bind) n=1 Tax=Blochmanniella pennsylvanica (strain BPEN) TaxID=291272 RepID=Q492U6_BLOPB|nr:Fe-S cluster assembly ATPase SufC [Candidatus Blochmannia pennsylvanicus]AAZ40996.1 putative transport protein associated with Fe-S cluster assembly (ABC superfamily, atp_bind) [Candidatus Blochmannia pennsylvanicus str. BPEN]